MSRRSAVRPVTTVLALTMGLLGPAVAGGTPAHAANGTVRITTGPTDVRDRAGNVWQASMGFVGGRDWRTGSPEDIRGTEDDDLYRSELAGLSAFRWDIDANATYSVTLKIAEIWHDAPGERVFSVSAEGRRVVEDLDLVGTAGRNVAVDRTFTIDVRDGFLDLAFTATRDLPKVSAISIRQVSPPFAPRTTAAPLGPPAVAPAAAAPTAAPAPAAPAATAAPTAAPAAPAAAPAPAPAYATNPSGGRPGAWNTGVPAGTTLRKHWGNLTLTTAGATYDSLDVHGFVTVQAPNVKITRSVIRGGVGTTNVGLITNYDRSATGFVLEDSELVPDHPSVYLDGIKGGNFTVRRSEIHGTVDGVKVHGDNVTVERTWIHDQRTYGWDPYQGGGQSHNDGVQVLGGRNIRITGNSISGASNAALQVTQDFSQTTDLVFSGNWADGGGCTVNLAHKRLSWMSGITLNDNRFGRGQRFGGCAMIATRATSESAWNNVWDDNGQAVPMRDGG